MCFSPCPKLLTKYETLVNTDTHVHKQFLTAKTDYHIQIFSILFVLYYITVLVKIFSENIFSSFFMKIYLLFCLNEILCTPEVTSVSTQMKEYGILGILKFSPDITSTPIKFHQE